MFNFQKHANISSPGMRFNVIFIIFPGINVSAVLVLYILYGWVLFLHTLHTLCSRIIFCRAQSTKWRVANVNGWVRFRVVSIWMGIYLSGQYRAIGFSWPRSGCLMLMGEGWLLYRDVKALEKSEYEWGFTALTRNLYIINSKWTAK